MASRYQMVWCSARRWFLVASACLLAVSCSETTEAPLEGPLFAKGGGGSGPQVDAIDPPNVLQGVTLNMTVTGAGFTLESQVSFELSGEETEMVLATSTTLVSDTELTANVTVADAALTVSYDVAVRNGNGPKKKGVGVELLKVDPKDPEPADPEILFKVQGTVADIRVIDASGANETVVFQSEPFYGNIGSPTWSPDGGQILFKLFDTFIMDVTIGADGQPVGSTPVKIVDRALGLTNPAWSPDGSEIVHAEGATDDYPSSIWVMNSDGSGLATVYDAAPGRWVYYTSWSPDGTRIAFVERRDVYDDAGNDSEIRVITRATGLVETILVTGEFYHIKFIDWARTGDQIAFEARLNGRRPKDRESRVYTVDVGSGSFTEITTGGHPTWSPDDSEIAFKAPNNRLDIITLSSGVVRTLTTSAPTFVNWRR